MRSGINGPSPVALGRGEEVALGASGREDRDGGLGPGDGVGEGVMGAPLLGAAVAGVCGKAPVRARGVELIACRGSCVAEFVLTVRVLSFVEDGG